MYEDDARQEWGAFASLNVAAPMWRDHEVTGVQFDQLQLKKHLMPVLKAWNR
jgi:hypothetical protein